MRRLACLLLPLLAGWTRLPGVWYPTTPAAPETVSLAAGRVSFHGFSAVRHDRAVSAGRDGAWTIAAKVDPVAGDTASLGWVSFMLSAKRDSLGWVTAPENAIGVLVRSNGNIQIFARGAELRPVWAAGPPAPSATYAVTLTVRRGSGNDKRVLRLEGRLNEARFSAELTGAAPDARPLFLAVGAHFHPGDVMASSVDELELNGARL